MQEFESLRRIRRMGSREREQLMRLLPDLMGFFFFRPALRQQLAGLSLVRTRLLECLLYFGVMRPSLIGGDSRLDLVPSGLLRMLSGLGFVLRGLLRVVGRFVRTLGRLLLVPRGILAVLLRVADGLRQLLGSRRRGTRKIVAPGHPTYRSTTAFTKRCIAARSLCRLPGDTIHATGFPRLRRVHNGTSRETISAYRA
jgi:hypothetical protein